MKPLFPEVVVNGQVVPAAEIAAEAQMHRAPKDKPGLAWRAAARALAVRALLLQAATMACLTPEPRSLGEGREESPEEALIRSYIDQRIEPDPVTEADCRAAYEERPPEAADMSYDDVVKALFESLERAAWTRAARDLVADLVAEADIEGVDMAPQHGAV